MEQEVLNKTSVVAGEVKEHSIKIGYSCPITNETQTRTIDKPIIHVANFYQFVIVKCNACGQYHKVAIH
ncbi:MAG TPA: hypothetical protein VK172_10335 [Lentimicrobium sp.]|nr:hypothetical protein [Lentimicrobium sp.]